MMAAEGVAERAPQIPETKAASREAFLQRRRRARRSAWDRLRGYGAALLWTPARVVSCFLPKDPQLWVFGGCRGADYADNARHLFQWMALHHPEVRCVWTTNDDHVFAKLAERGLDVEQTFTWGGTKLHMRAGVAVTSHGSTYDLHRFVVAGRTKILQLGSGTALARHGRDLDVGPTKRGPLRRLWRGLLAAVDRLLPSEVDRFDLLTVASTHAVPNAVSAHGCTRDRIVVTGLARTDLMAQRRLRMRLGPRRVLYMPGGLATSFSHASFDALADLDPAMADAKLEACDAELFVPIGDGHVPSVDSLHRLALCERVHLFECGDLHHHLDGFDAFVTDGANAFCDYLLLDRPILFFRRPEFDVAADRERWLYYDWDWLRCGPLVRSFDDLFTELGRELEDPSRHAEDRRRTRKLFHDHEDAQNCRRIYESIV